MTQKKTTKRALLVSVLSMVACLALLVGSTFAWFTDAVSTRVNNIEAGNLAVGMEYADGKADPATVTFEDAAGASIFNYNLWEPGYTVAKHIKISNKGDLALKYQLDFLMDGEPGKLAEVIDVYFADPAVQVADRTLTGLTKVGTLKEFLAGAKINPEKGALLGGDSVTVTIVLKMQEGANNDYKNATVGSNFTIRLYATQNTVESDSFDNQYDAESPYPSVTSQEVDTANTNVVEAGGVSVTMEPDAIPAGVTDVTLSVVDLNDATPSGVVVEDTAEVKSYEITLVDQNGNKVAPVAGKTYTVTIPVAAGKNAANLKIYHKSEEITNFDYDAVNGGATFEVTSFSPFTVVDMSASAAAASDALNSVKAGDTLELEKLTLNLTQDIPANVTISGKPGAEPTLLVDSEKGINIGAGVTLENVIIKDAYSGRGRYYCGIVNLRGDGATLKNCTIIGKGATTWDAAVYVNLNPGGVAYITDCDIKGGFRGLFLGSQSGSIVVDGCTVNPTAYTISVDGGGKFGLDISNSTLNGWLSYSHMDSVNFTNCKFGSNGSYAFYRPYCGSTLTNCEFEAGYEIDTAQTSETVTLVGCKLDGEALTADNAAPLFGGAVPENTVIE